MAHHAVRTWRRSARVRAPESTGNSHRHPPKRCALVGLDRIVEGFRMSSSPTLSPILLDERKDAQDDSDYRDVSSVPDRNFFYQGAQDDGGEASPLVLVVVAALPIALVFWTFVAWAIWSAFQ